MAVRKPNTTCELCQSPFYVKPSVKAAGQGRFCSRECYYTFAGKAAPQPYPQTKQCEHCDGPFLIHNRSLRGKRFCSHSCSRVVANRNRVGIKYKVNSDPFRKKLLRIYPHACMCPDCDYVTFVDSHHIIPKKEDGPNTIENGILLCPNHHKEADRGLISRETLNLWKSLVDNVS